MKRALKDAAKLASRKLFELGQRLGVDILPRHFYSSIPEIAALRRQTTWRRPLSMHGVQGTDTADQVAFLADLCPPPLTEAWATLDVHGAADRANGQGGGYGVVEAEALHAFVVRHRPGKVIQIGCGVSTAIVLRAGAAAGYRPEVVCIEPFPSAYLRAAAAHGEILLISEMAQEVDLEVLTALDAGDLLFVDSTHAVKPGGEVVRIILEVLPRLRQGVFVHFHDIYFPYDYCRGILAKDLFFPTESTLLHAYLADNPRCRIVLSLSMLHYRAPESLRRAFPRYVPQANDEGLEAGAEGDFPSATYLEMNAP